MKTIILDRARYTVRDDRHTLLSDVLKLTGKHKPVKPKGGCERRYPADGASLSTAAYVGQYYALNSTRRLFKNLAAPYGDANLVGFYEGLSNRVSIPEGEDSMRTEFHNEEFQITSEVTQTPDGRWRVMLRDDDSGQTLDTIRFYSNEADALAYAERLCL